MRLFYALHWKVIGREITRRVHLMLLFVLLSSITLFGQAPDGYYDAANGKTGKELKTALFEIIKGHTVISYDGLYSAYQTTDNIVVNGNNKVYDMYSMKSDGTANYYYSHTSSDQCGTYNSEADCYNREHSMPQSWFNEASPMVSDLFHVYPTDGYVNNRRSNYPFGTVNSPTYTSSNGSKLGNSSYSGYTGIVFEPIDEFKGDFARTYFYMATRYEDKISSWPANSSTAAAILAGNSYPAFKDWYVSLLLEWNRIDPVSTKEMNRNNAVYALQHNRNPFIDHPEYAEQIWGNGSVNVSFTSSANTTAQAGSVYTYNITVTGSSGATFTITAPTKPTWLTLTSTGNGTATLSGTPAEANVGPNSVVLNVTDGTSSANQSFTITVASSIVPLQFTSTPVTTGLVGTGYNYNVSVTGNSGSTFTINATTKPDWLTLTSTGNGTATLSGTPTASGTSNVVLTASDGASSVNQSFTINVTAVSTGSWATETFENMPASSTSYSNISWTGDNKINWTAIYARTDQTINTRAICFKDITSTLPYLQSQTITGGCTQIRFKHQQKFSGSGGIITLYVNNSSIGTANVTTTVQTSTFTVNVSGDFVIKLVSNGAARIAIDDLEWTQPESIPNELPNISSFNSTPLSPAVGQTIAISATITDTDGTVESAILGWGATEEATDFSANMTANGDVYSTTVPAQTQVGTLYFKISAADNSGDVSYSYHSLTITENQAPEISSISQNPSNPTSTSEVVITADIVDPEGSLSSAILYWGLSDVSLSNQIMMNASAPTYTATIPAQTGEQTIYYRIIASDTEGNQSQSSILSYYVENSTGNILPVISAIEINPVNPVTGLSISVSANTTDSDGTVTKVLLNWGTTAEANDSNIEMSANGNDYSALIPAQSAAGTLYYRIEAIDNSGDTAKYNSSITIGVNELPTISDISIEPITPRFIDNVVVTAQVIDPEGRLGDVKLYWGLTNDNLSNELSMTDVSSSFSAIIPAQTANQAVYYKIIANDQESNQNQSSILSYTVLANESPVIKNININPTSPTFADNVTISAEVEDPEGHMDNVKLLWGLTEGDLTNEITMTSAASFYSATVPAQASSQTVYYRIVATDLEATQGKSNILSYTVLANGVPTISNIVINPETPAFTDNVTIAAEVVDPENRLGNVKLYWGLTESELTNELSMTNVSATFSATIPAQAASQTIYFRIIASDQESNQSQSDILNYTVMANLAPSISNITINPASPTSTDNVNISAQVVDPEGRLYNVKLYWGLTATGLSNELIMTNSSSTFSAVIPSQTGGQTVYYRIIAKDQENSQTQSEILSYSVTVNNELPIISSVILNPTNPVTGQSITISANIVDSDGNIEKALLSWGVTSDANDNSVEMESNNSNYSAVIPSQTQAKTLYYKILAIDNADGSADYSQSFTIATNQTPVINNVSRNPENPTSADNVSISAQVSDPEGRLGTVLIQWGYASNTMNYQITMTNSTSTYSGTIPLQTTGVTVYYRIKAYDMEGNQTYSDILSYTVSPASSIGDNTSESVRVYPNPFTDAINIEVENPGKTKVMVMDIIGKVVYQIDFSDKTYPINASNLKTGIYIVKITNNNKTTVLRVVKR